MSSKRPRRAPAPASTTRPSPYRYRTVVEDGIRYPGEYWVYDRASGDYLGKVHRNDAILPGHGGRWQMATGYKTPTGHAVKGRDATRDGAVAEALEIRARRQDAR